MKTPVKFLKDSQRSKRVLPQFYPSGKMLRTHFDERFSNPLQANRDRFCWDYWSVPNQYRLLRTPASSFFPESLFQPFLNHLLNFGRTNLGCQMISHPWVSAYIDGSFQNLHSDVPHRPFSFVYSLTNWNQRTFTGGETLVAKPKLLRYFSEIQTDQSHETDDFLEKIEPKFNQLTLFDPRYPHGVERVLGVESVLESRLVVHGWFTEPRPMLEGTLTFKKLSKNLDFMAEALLAHYGALPYSGLFAFRFKILPSGKIAHYEILSANLIDSFGREIPKRTLMAPLQNPEFMFPKSNGNTWITLPLQIHSWIKIKFLLFRRFLFGGLLFARLLFARLFLERFIFSFLLGFLLCCFFICGFFCGLFGHFFALQLFNHLA